MQVAIVNNNEISSIDSIYTLFPNVSFPVTGVDNAFLTDHSLLPLQVWEVFDSTTEKLVNCQPYIKDGKVFTYIKETKTQEELIADLELTSLRTVDDIRFKRNQLLKDSDWTQVADAPVDKEAWATYRQELRDITSQTGFPDNIIFPSPPN